MENILENENILSRELKERTAVANCNLQQSCITLLRECQVFLIFFCLLFLFLILVSLDKLEQGSFSIHFTVLNFKHLLFTTLRWLRLFSAVKNISFTVSVTLTGYTLFLFVCIYGKKSSENSSST
jgi:hypothetical protein